jgi:hypothetical protein
MAVNAMPHEVAGKVDNTLLHGPQTGGSVPLFSPCNLESAGLIAFWGHPIAHR